MKTTPSYDVVPFFSELLPTLNSDTLGRLRAEIEADGRCRDALVVAVIPSRKRPVLIDGHQRVSIVAELRDAGKPIAEPVVVAKEFATDLDAQLWMLRNPRRNPDAWDRARAVLKLRDALTARGKERMSDGGRAGKVCHSRQTFNARKTMAEIADVGETVMQQVMTISDQTPDYAAEIDATLSRERQPVGALYKEMAIRLISVLPRPPAPRASVCGNTQPLPWFQAASSATRTRSLMCCAPTKCSMVCGAADAPDALLIGLQSDTFRTQRDAGIKCRLPCRHDFSSVIPAIADGASLAATWRRHRTWRRTQLHPSETLVACARRK